RSDFNSWSISAHKWRVRHVNSTSFTRRALMLAAIVEPATSVSTARSVSRLASGSAKHVAAHYAPLRRRDDEVGQPIGALPLHRELALIHTVFRDDVLQLFDVQRGKLPAKTIFASIPEYFHRVEGAFVPSLRLAGPGLGSRRFDFL